MLPGELLEARAAQSGGLGVAVQSAGTGSLGVTRPVRGGRPGHADVLRLQRQPPFPTLIVGDGDQGVPRGRVAQVRRSDAAPALLLPRAGLTSKAMPPTLCTKPGRRLRNTRVARSRSHAIGASRFRSAAVDESMLPQSRSSSKRAPRWRKSRACRTCAATPGRKLAPARGRRGGQPRAEAHGLGGGGRAARHRGGPSPVGRRRVGPGGQIAPRQDGQHPAGRRVTVIVRNVHGVTS